MNKELKMIDFLKFKINHFFKLNKIIVLNNKKDSHERRCTLIELSLLYDIPIIVVDKNSYNQILCKKRIYFKEKKEIKILIANSNMIKKKNGSDYVLIDESVDWVTLMNIIMPYSKRHMGYIYNANKKVS